MTFRSRQRRSAEDGPPDPAAGLDRLEEWIERRLPSSPRPLWAEGVIVVLRLLVGRGSWVLGTLFFAMGAPWFVLIHRQIDTMVRAAWYRSTATATATARVERVELRLITGVWDGVQRVVPSVLLSFTPGAGGERLWVRYLPHGEGLEAQNQWGSSPPLLASPPTITPGWRFRWADATGTDPGFDLLWSESDAPLFESATPWNGETYLANVLADLDRPIDLLVGDWTRGATDATELKVRFRPESPQRIFVADALSHLPPSGGNGFAEVFFSLLLALPFGLPFWWVGTRLLSRGVAPRHRHLFVWVPLVLLPLWGPRYLEILERLSPGALERNAILAKIGSTQVLPGAEPAGPGPSFDRRRRIDFESSRFAATLALVDLSRPPKRLANGDAVWREVEGRFTRALATLDDDAFARALDRAQAAESWTGPPALLPMLAEGARQAALDPARNAAARAAALQVLGSLTARSAIDLCHPGFRAYREDLERIALLPESGISEPAKERLDEIAEWIAARKRDWGKVC
jgi:hypothetical protein